MKKIVYHENIIVYNIVICSLLITVFCVAEHIAKKCESGGAFMKKVLKCGKFLYFFTCWWFVLSMHAHAYIDPSAVTYTIQAVAAVFIALGALLTVFRHKIFALFKKNGTKTEKKEIHLKEDLDSEETK